MTFTNSKGTADFIVDCIEKYWSDNYYNTGKDTLIINSCGEKACKGIIESLEKCINRLDGIEKWFVILEPDKIRYAI